MKLTGIIRNFQLIGKVTSVIPYGSGHINDTYKIAISGSKKQNFLLQKINNRVFKNIPDLMENIQRVTNHQRKKISEIPGSDPERESLTIIPTLDGKPYFQNDEGQFYRMYLFIEDHKSYDIVENSKQAFEAGRMYGKFQNLITDLPGKPLNVTIMDFHNLESRLSALFESINKDVAGRISSVQDEVRFLEKRRDEMLVLSEVAGNGLIPERITHNDTKINNVLFDNNDRGLCVIDLDTVMPGLAHFDYGDSIRTSACTAVEDEQDLDRVEMDIGLFEAYTRGYLQEMTDLTEMEVKYLPLAAKIFPYAQGIRFLTDYLDGDLYYKTIRPDHNLHRTRNQFKLLNSMESQYDKMKEIVDRINLELAG